MTKGIRSTALALFVTVAFLGLPAVADASGLVGMWHLDSIFGPGDQQFTTDSSGNGYTLQVFGATVVPGRFENALSLDGSTSSLYRADGPALESPQVTVLAWVKSSDPGASRYIVAKGADAGCGGSSYALRTDSAKRAEFYIWDGVHPVVESPVAASSAVWDGNWHALAGSFDGAAVHLYLDGSEVGAGTATSTTIDYAIGHAFDIGEFPGAGPGCGPFKYSGAIDEVRVYSRALTGTEIHDLQTASGPDPPPIGTTPTSTSLHCVPSDLAIRSAATCTATVSSSSTPTGDVQFVSNSSGVFRAPGPSCALAPVPGGASCHVDYVPLAMGSGTHRITAAYGGDADHLASSDGTDLRVRRPSSTVVLCAPHPAVSLRRSITCWARVYDSGRGSKVLPNGRVSFGFSHRAGLFHLALQFKSCRLAAVPHGTAYHACRVHYTPTAVAPYGISAAYGGDALHTESRQATNIEVWRFTRTTMKCSPHSLGFHEHARCTARVVDLTPQRYRSLPRGKVFFSGHVGSYLPHGNCKLRRDSTHGDSFCRVTYVPHDAKGRYALTASYPGDATYRGSGDDTDVSVDYGNTRTKLSCDPGSVDEFHTIRCLVQVFDADQGKPARPPTGDISWKGNLGTAMFIPTDSCHLHAAFPESAGFSACNVGFRLRDQFPGIPDGLAIDAVYQPDSSHWLGSSDSVWKSIKSECIPPDDLFDTAWETAASILGLYGCAVGKITPVDVPGGDAGTVASFGPDKGTDFVGHYGKWPLGTPINLSVQRCPGGQPLSAC